MHQSLSSDNWCYGGTPTHVFSYISWLFTCSSNHFLLFLGRQLEYISQPPLQSGWSQAWVLDNGLWGRWLSLFQIWRINTSHEILPHILPGCLELSASRLSLWRLSEAEMARREVTLTIILYGKFLSVYTQEDLGRNIKMEELPLAWVTEWLSGTEHISAKMTSR